MTARPASARAVATLAASAAHHWLIRDVLVPIVATRALLTLIGLLAVWLLPVAPWPGTWTNWSQPWMDIWSRWDGRWYLSVVQEGYSYSPYEHSNVAFSPLYPLLTKVGAVLIGQDYAEGWVVSGLVVANGALIVGAAFLYQLVRLERDAATARQAVAYLLVFPSSLFLSAVYADSLYLALAVGAYYAARRERWWLAGVLGGLGALARPHGVLIVVPLALEYAARCEFDWRKVRADALALGLVPAGLAAWAVYLAARFGDPFLFVTAQAAWRRELTPPWEMMRRFLEGPIVPHGTIYSWDYSQLDLAFSIAFLALVAATWRLLRPSLALYATVMLISMSTTGTLAASMRYGLALFPVFLVLAVAGRHPAFHQGYLVLASCLSGLLMALFAAGYWVA